MKKILFLTTGGTIACTVTDEGLEPTLKGEDILKQVPELRTLGEITVQDLTLLDSSNLEPAHWSAWARLIGDNYSDYDAFVLTHGTDTMAYTSSALSRMLINLGKPVVLTGAQVPLSQRCPEQPGTGVFRGGQRAARSLRGLWEQGDQGGLCQEDLYPEPQRL